MCFRQVVLRQILQTFLAVHGHEDADHERDQRLVGADVRRRLLAADVLLAGGKREHESALAVAVVSLADEAAGHLPHKLVARGHHAAVGAAKSERHAERLRFHADDIGLDGRLYDAQRNRFGDGDNQQRAFLVDDVGYRGNVFDDAEEVRATGSARQRFRCRSPDQGSQINAAVLLIADG